MGNPSGNAVAKIVLRILCTFVFVLGSHGVGADGPGGRYVPVENVLDGGGARMAAMLVGIYEKSNVVPPYDQLYAYLMNPLGGRVPDDWMIRFVDEIEPFRRTYWEFSTETDLFVAKEFGTNEMMVCDLNKEGMNATEAYTIKPGFRLEWPGEVKSYDSSFNCGMGVRIKKDESFRTMDRSLRSLKENGGIEFSQIGRVILNFRIDRVVQTKKVPNFFGHWVVGTVEEVWVGLKAADWHWYRVLVCGERAPDDTRDGVCY